jgi:hypothetical protein
MIKPVKTPESENTKGHRRLISAGNIMLPTNDHSLDERIHPSTLPMRTVVECTPSRQPKGRQTNFPGGLSSPCNYKVTRVRSTGEDMFDAVKYSPTTHSPWGNQTLKHPAFTARKNRNDQEEG